MLAEPGFVTIFGSGEAAPSGRSVYDWLFGRLPRPIRVAVLETPAGFEPNSARVAARIAAFLRERLPGFQPEVTVVAARKRGSAFSPDDPALVEPLLRAGAILLGPGSPTYAVRQLQGSLAWQYLLARHRGGAAIVLASAAAIAAGAFVLPVYEIYKVGADLHWQRGLDLFGAYGLALAIVPHWDNAEGGADLDTSRCYVGAARFEALLALLPPEVTVVGVDEHTALVVDIAAGVCRVLGRGGVSLLRQGQERRVAGGETFPIADLGPFRLPAPGEGLAGGVLPRAPAPRTPAPAPAPPAEVLAMVQAREAARARRDWPAADALRARILALGWQIGDRPTGPQLTPVPSPPQWRGSG